jgi:hypothetical protein
MTAIHLQRQSMRCLILVAKNNYDATTCQNIKPPLRSEMLSVWTEIDLDAAADGWEACLKMLVRAIQIDDRREMAGPQFVYVMRCPISSDLAP